jgi:hypothetical protein
VDPQTVGISGDPGQVDPSAVQLDEEQRVQPLQPDRVDGEEVARNDPGAPAGVGTSATCWRSSAAPAPVRGGAASSGSRSPRRARRGATVLLGCAGSPSAGSPSRGRRSAAAPPGPAVAGRSGGGVGPRPGDQSPMPTQQRVGLHQEAGPAGSREDAADLGEQRPIGRLQLGTWDLSAQDGELVAQHEDLQVLGGLATSQQHEQLDRAAERQVGELRQRRVVSERSAEASQLPRRRGANRQLGGHVGVCAPYGLAMPGIAFGRVGPG